MPRSRRKVADFIRQCVERAEQGDDTCIEIRQHFRDQMRERGLFWSDVASALLEPSGVELRGRDEQQRRQVWVFGTVLGGGTIRIVCSIDWGTRLITLNWD